MNSGPLAAAKTGERGESVKFLGGARAAVLAAAVVAEVAGLGFTVLPALAVTPVHGGPPVITVTAGGDRTSSNAVSGTAGSADG